MHPTDVLRIHNCLKHARNGTLDCLNRGRGYPVLFRHRTSLAGRRSLAITQNKSTERAERLALRRQPGVWFAAQAAAGPMALHAASLPAASE